MFSFFSRQRLVKVRALLEGRVNRTYARQLQEGVRHGARGALCEVAFLVPYAGRRTPDFANARSVLTRDMSWAGMSVLDERLLDAETCVVALGNEDQFKFLHCLVEHCTHLGYGHFQIGLQPTELVELGEEEMEAFRQRLAECEVDVAANDRTATQSGVLAPVSSVQS